MSDIKIRLNMEVGYRVERITDRGFIDFQQDINKEELGECIGDICMLATGDEEDAERLKDMLRFGYTHLKAQTFTLKEK